MKDSISILRPQTRSQKMTQMLMDTKGCYEIFEYTVTLRKGSKLGMKLLEEKYDGKDVSNDFKKLFPKHHISQTIVSKVNPGGAAENAGLLVGDVLCASANRVSRRNYNHWILIDEETFLKHKNKAENNAVDNKLYSFVICIARAKTITRPPKHVPPDPVLVSSKRKKDSSPDSSVEGPPIKRRVVELESILNTSSPKFSSAIVSYQRKEPAKVGESGTKKKVRWSLDDQTSGAIPSNMSKNLPTKDPADNVDTEQVIVPVTNSEQQKANMIINELEESTCKLLIKYQLLIVKQEKAKKDFHQWKKLFTPIVNDRSHLDEPIFVNNNNDDFKNKIQPPETNKSQYYQYLDLYLIYLVDLRKQNTSLKAAVFALEQNIKNIHDAIKSMMTNVKEQLTVEEEKLQES